MTPILVGAPKDHQNTNPIKRLPPPQDPGDAVNKEYADNIALALSTLVSAVTASWGTTIKTAPQNLPDNSSVTFLVPGLTSGKANVRSLSIFLLCIQAEGGYQPGEIITPSSKYCVEVLDSAIVLHSAAEGIKYVAKAAPRGELACTAGYWQVYSVVTFVA